MTIVGCQPAGRALVKGANRFIFRRAWRAGYPPESDPE